MAILPLIARSGKHDLRLALYQPDIPQNTGALLRLAACFTVGVDLIEPMGFLFDDRRLRRAALDYAALVDLRRYSSWSAFVAERDRASRLVLMTTAGTCRCTVRLCGRRYDPARPRDRGGATRGA